MLSVFEAAASRYPGESDEEGATRFTAGRLERRSGMRISRFGWAFGKDSTFVCDGELIAATTMPPPPFSGRAEFRRSASGPTWAGSLKVELPGIGAVPLTGDAYSARLYWGEPEQAPGY